MTILRSFPNITVEVGLTGKFQGKDAKVFNLMGRRATFADTTTFHDIVEYSLGSLVNGNRSAHFPTTNESATIVSTSSTDSSSGTGVRQVRILYLNSSYEVKETTVTLNGVTPVSVAADVFRVLNMHSVAVGANGYAGGTILLSGSGGPLEQISANTNRSLSGKFTVPAGYRAFLYDEIYSASSNSGDFRLRSNFSSWGPTVLTAGIWNFQDQLFVPSNGVVASNGQPVMYEEGVDIKISALAGSTGTVLRFNAEVILVKK